MKSPSTDSTESFAEPTCGLREKTSARPDRQHVASHRLTRTRTVAHECSTTPPALCVDSPHRGLGTSSRFLGQAHLVSLGQNWGSPKTTWVPGNRFTNTFHGRKNNSESTIPTRTLIAGILLGTVNAHVYASQLYVRSHITGNISTTIGIPTFSRWGVANSTVGYKVPSVEFNGALTVHRCQSWPLPGLQKSTCFHSV